MTTPAPDAPPRLFALVPCAGVGERAATGVPKQYAAVAGQPMVAHTLLALGAVARLTATLVVLAPDDDRFEASVPGYVGQRQWLARCGGASRAATVANGLDELLARGARAHDWVLVHDAARCLLRSAWVDRLIDSCLDDEVGGLLALPLVDTLKEERAGRSARTLDRGGKWAAQTPQMFRLGALKDALSRSGGDVTDEASAIEALGLRPILVPGELENFKLTWPGDMALAARLLSQAGSGAPAGRVSTPAGGSADGLADGRPQGMMPTARPPDRRGADDDPTAEDQPGVTMPVVWRDKLNTGNNIIDRDHKYLFCLFNSIELAVSHPDLLKHLPVFFGQLLEYTREHFVREEMIQVKINYPDHVEHRRKHREILEQLEATHLKVSRLDSPSEDAAEQAKLKEELTSEALNLAREWIINHVVKVDCGMIPYLGRYSANFE